MEEKKQGVSGVIIFLVLFALLVGVVCGYLLSNMYPGKITEIFGETEKTQNTVFELTSFLGGDWSDLESNLRSNKDQIQENGVTDAGEEWKSYEVESSHLKIVTITQENRERVYRLTVDGDCAPYSLMDLAYGMEIEQARNLLKEKGFQETDVYDLDGEILFLTAMNPDGRVCMLQVQNRKISGIEGMLGVADDGENREVKEKTTYHAEQKEDSWNDRAQNNVKYPVDSDEEEEDSVFHNVDVILSSVYNPTTGLGYNQNGELISDCLEISTKLTDKFPEFYKNAIVTCSWGHVINGEGYWEQHADMETAKSGGTYLETYQISDENDKATEYGWMIFLPDDPDIAGMQSVTVKVGKEEKTVWVDLEYQGDYNTGLGWKLIGVQK